MLLALVRERWPGTVDVPLSPPCKLLFSTAFMFSCSAASSAYWIPWGWLSCASDGGALPNLPFCMKEGDTKISPSLTVTGRRWKKKHAVALGACETCHVGQSVPKLEQLVIKLKVPLHNLRTAYCCIVCCNNGDMPVGRDQILWSIYFYQEEAAAAPPSAIHSTLQPASCKHLFHPPCRRLGASSFTRGRTHTGPVILSLVTCTTCYVVNPHKHTGFLFRLNDNAACFNVSLRGEAACTRLHTVTSLSSSSLYRSRRK